MSLIFAAARNTRQIKKSSEITKRDMSKKKKVIRKVRDLPEDGKPTETTSWNIEHLEKCYTIAFSRDNLHVIINGRQVEVTGYITDKGYDLDLFFDCDNWKGHIYSDVEGSEMINYLLINDEVKGMDYQAEADVNPPATKN